jgi:hypothetical protein
MTDQGDTNKSNGVSLPPSLDHARIATLPESAFYIPNFISEDEERMILDKVRDLVHQVQFH